MRKMKSRSFYLDLFLRYSILITFGIILPVFYFIFTPPNLFLLNKLLSLWFQIKIKANIIYGPKIIEIIPACIGASAYYLILILNLSTPNIDVKKRLFSIIFMFFSFFVFNFFRLLILISLEFIGFNTYFYHKFLWYFGSTIFVFLLWLINIKIFKIKKIPIVSDVINVWNLAK